MRAQHSVSPDRWLVLFVACLAVAGGAFTAVLAEPGADLPLVEAVKSRDTDAVRTLLAEGVDVNAPQSDGATALHWAAYRDDVDTAALLIEAGANVNTANELGATPLWLAADNGSPTMIERLLDAGANPNVALPEGETPVMTASRTGNADVVRLLLAHGAALNVSEHSRGQTALMWAVAQGHHAVVATLLEHGADVAARSKARPRLMHADSTNASQYDQGVMWNRGGFTPLLFAARHGDIDSARLLLRAGAEVNDTAPTGASALVVAAHSGHGAFAATLLDEGADPNAAGAGYTALHSAILRGDRTLVEQLLNHGANPNARLEKGKSGLGAQPVAGERDAVLARRLLSRPADHACAGGGRRRSAVDDARALAASCRTRWGRRPAAYRGRVHDPGDGGRAWHEQPGSFLQHVAP